ncbi:MAG: dienelactone hydrolase family protein [Desulfobacterales bacterium]|nr:dienelactone hydrolase family protein [Desulfobacterales bacterium]
MAGEIIKTPADGLTVADGKVDSGGFQLPIYEARPADAGKYPVVIVIPEIWGMHEYIKDVVRRFAKRGFLAITFEPYARTGGVLQIEDREAAAEGGQCRAGRPGHGGPQRHRRLREEASGSAGRPDRGDGVLPRGLYTLLFAAQSPDVKAAVPWYGQIKPAKTRGHPHGRAAGSGGSDQGARAGALRRSRPGHPGGRCQGDGVRAQGGRQDGRVRALPGCAARLPRGLPAQLPGKPPPRTPGRAAWRGSTSIFKPDASQGEIKSPRPPFPKGERHHDVLLLPFYQRVRGDLEATSFEAGYGALRRPYCGTKFPCKGGETPASSYSPLPKGVGGVLEAAPTAARRGRGI